MARKKQDQTQLLHWDPNLFCMLHPYDLHYLLEVSPEILSNALASTANDSSQRGFSNILSAPFFAVANHVHYLSKVWGWEDRFMFLKEVCFAHQYCIHLIQKYNKIWIVLFLNILKSNLFLWWLRIFKIQTSSNMLIWCSRNILIISYVESCVAWYFYELSDK